MRGVCPRRLLARASILSYRDITLADGEGKTFQSFLRFAMLGATALLVGLGQCGAGLNAGALGRKALTLLGGRRLGLFLYTSGFGDVRCSCVPPFGGGANLGGGRWPWAPPPRMFDFFSRHRITLYHRFLTSLLAPPPG